MNGIYATSGIYAMKNAGLRGLLILAVLVTSAWSQPDEEFWDVETPTPLEVYANDGYEALGYYCGNLASDGITYITDVFGTLRTDGYPHIGIDIGTNFEQNLAVRTPMSGKVVFAGLLEDYGLSIIIENDGYQVSTSSTYQVLLAHASSLTQSAAQVVQAGDVVMLSGGANGDWRDGNSSGAHIHFEIRKCSETGCRVVDPMTAYLPGQTQTCNWYQAVSDPSSNIRKARLDSNNLP
ncbi:MAG: M23 family metallopeptidase [Chloroflexi bacterium]|nr:M23 family metallopeptidase [Chloroflexota bacterium]